MEQIRTTWTRDRLPQFYRWALPALTLSAGLLGAPAPAHAASRAVGEYVPVVLQEDGKATDAALDQLVANLRRQGQTGDRPIVLMLHGFDSNPDRGRKDYNHISHKLQEVARKYELPVSPVGVHWASNAGDRGKWMLQATGSRITSLLGFKKAIKNPYLDRCAMASQVGRTGFRSVVFRLHEAFPQAPVHVVAHSMGAQVVVSALGPQACEKDEARYPTVRPQDSLSLGMVTLAGADLDCDTFTRKENTVARNALGQAQVWWFTVPEPGGADGILELRRGAGKGDAVGNKGLKLTEEDLNSLLARRALVMEQGNTPSNHSIEEYFNTRRMDALVTSMAYLRNPQAQAGQGSVLARLDHVLESPFRETARLATDGNTCVRLYAAWKANAGLSNIHVVSVVNNRKGEPGGMQATR